MGNLFLANYANRNDVSQFNVPKRLREVGITDLGLHGKPPSTDLSLTCDTVGLDAPWY